MQAFSVTQSTGLYDALMQTGRPAKYSRLPLGQRIVAFRERAGLSQQQLADKINVNQQTVAYWERRSISVRSEHISALADALGVSVDQLLGKAHLQVRGGGPVGKVRQVFESVSRLPRRQQQKIVEVVEALVNQHGNGHSKAS